MAGSRQERTPNPYVSPTAMNAFLLMLARCINPDTGEVYTHEALAEIFGWSASKVATFLNGHGIRRRLRPEVSKDLIPENEKAFYLGLALGNFQIGHTTWVNREYVYIATGSNDSKRRDLLRKTVGKRGVIHESQRQLRIYLDSGSFGFLSAEFIENPDRIINASFLSSAGKFGPFLVGLLSVRLSEREGLVTLPNPRLRDAVHNAFERHYRFSMGGKIHRKDVASASIAIHNPNRVFEALLGTRSVQTLPFLRAFMPQAPNPDGRADRILQGGAIFP